MITGRNEEWLEEVILEAAFRLRSLGYRISTAEIVKAVELAESYRVLTGSLNREDLELVLESTFTSSNPPREVVEAALRRVLAGRGVRERAERIKKKIYEELENMKLKPGDTVSRRKIASRIRDKRERRKALASYMILREVGVVRGRPGRERIATREEIERISWEIARMGFDGLEDASSSLWRRGLDALMGAAEARMRPKGDVLEGLSEKQLIRLARAADKKHDRRMHRMVAEELARRVMSGFRVRSPEEVARILEKEDLLTTGVRRKLAESGGLASEHLTLDDVVHVASTVDPEEGARMIAKHVSGLPPQDAHALMSRVDPRLLWAVKERLVSDPSYRALVYAAKALREAIRFVETGEEGRADMANYYHDKAMRILGESGTDTPQASNALRLLREARAMVSLVESVGESPDRRLLEDALRGLDFTTTIRVLRKTYKAAGPEWRRLIISAAERILYRFSSSEGLRLLPKKSRAKRPPGRLDVRMSIYGILRYSTNPLVYSRKKRAALVNLALDSSGSMIEYSAWALGVASIFPRHLRRLVIFSHEARVYEGPFTRTSFVTALLEAEFRGLTNISRALRLLDVPGVRRLVVITDLKQTVDDEPVESVVRALSRSGKRIVFIVPRSHDAGLRSLVEEAGARVLVASSPRSAAQHLLRVFLRA